MKIYDILFVGAGPVALYGMYYAGLRMMKMAAIDTLPEVGGTLTAIYPEKYIYDVPGHVKILSKTLVQNLLAQADQYPNDMFLDEAVKDLLCLGNPPIWELETSKGSHFTKSVIITTGLGSRVPKKLGMEEEDTFEDKGIHYWIKDPEYFRGKRVLVVGGGDTAFDYSLMLEPVAKSVIHIHRNSFFRAHAATVKKVQESSVEMKFPFWKINKILGKDRVEGVIIKSKEETLEISVDEIVLGLGFTIDSNMIDAWHLESSRAVIKVGTKMDTNLKGIYAAGDSADYPGKVKLISVGWGEVAIAVNNAINYMYPDKSTFPGHSSEIHEKVQEKIFGK